jgi:hypothetical protein
MIADHDLEPRGRGQTGCRSDDQSPERLVPVFAEDPDRCLGHSQRGLAQRQDPDRLERPRLQASQPLSDRRAGRNRRGSNSIELGQELSGGTL